MKRRARFNLLLLDESEVYFDEYIATLTEVAEPKLAASASGKRDDRSKPKTASGQTGRLLVCSRGIFFEPDDFKTPLYKFPYRFMPAAPSADAESTSTFLFQATQALRMKKSGSVAPYVTQMLGSGPQSSPIRPASSSTSPSTQPPTFAVTLQHSDVSPVLTLTHRLWSIAAEAKAGNRSREQDFLKPLIYSRHMGSFDLSLLLDYRERPLSGTLLVEKIRPLVSCPCRLVLTNEALYLQPVPLNNIGESVSKIRIRTITDSVRRRRLLREIGLEVTLSDGNGVFLAFETQSERDATYSQLQELIAFHADKAEKQESGIVRQNSSGKDVSASSDDARGSENWRLQKLRAMTLLWQEHGISNYEYLMFLNSAADRTSYDLTQYPVFPWVIADYKSATLHLEEPATFRDLSKPIGALNPSRLELFLSRFREMPKGTGLDAPFMYGTHYSAPGYVLFYLLRKMPEHMLRLQSGKFDSPDRMFNSIAETWVGVNTNPADLKELIPEFYNGDGDFLRNSASLELGLRADGRPVGDVELPPWAVNASDFVSKCRKALECDFVSKRIHHWIDLVFGHRQRGKGAEEAFNVFHPVTYEGVADTERESDPMKRAALVMQISEFGQTPRQIFKSAHPVRTGPVIAAPLPQPVSVDDDDETEVAAVAKEKGGSGAVVEQELDVTMDTPTELATKFVFGTDEPATTVNDSITEAVNAAAELQTLVNYDSILSGWSPANLVNNPEYLRQARVAKDAVTVAVMSSRSDRQLLYIGSRDGYLLVYNFEKLEVVSETKVASESEPERPVAITAIMLPKSEQFAVLTTFNGYIRVFSFSTQAIVQSICAHDAPLLCATLSKSDHTILTGAACGELKVWQLCEDQLATDGAVVTDTPLRTIAEHTAAVTAVAVDAAAEICYIGFADARLLVFDLLVGACVAVKRDFEPECVKGDVLSCGVSGISCIVAVTVHHNSNHVPAAVIGLVDGRIALVTADGQLIGTLYSGEVLRCLAYDAATNTVVSNGLSGVVKFWDFTLITAALDMTSSSGGVVMDESGLRVKGLSRFLRTVVLGCARQAKECFIGSFADATTSTDGYTVLPASGVTEMDPAEAELMFGGHLQTIATSMCAVFGCGPDGQFTAVGLLCGYRGGGVRLWTR